VAKRSAGLLIYRSRSGALEVLLVHPGGPFFKNKDLGAWSIPKGEIEDAEDALAAACREVREEIGIAAVGPFLELGSVTQRGGKIVIAYACAGDHAVEAIESNHFELEWPPRSGRRVSFPEVDRAAYFALSEARAKINPAQSALLDRLELELSR
jgi:predicted NUDIX family NTP pyrophosphohydrolase